MNALIRGIVIPSRMTARYSNENFTLYAEVYPLFSVVALLILPLRMKFTPKEM